MPDGRLNHTDHATFLHEVATAISRRAPDRQSVGLLVLDIDNLHHLVSTLGFQAGNALVVELALRLRSSTRTCDRLIRISDGRFAVILGGAKNEGHAILAANKLVRAGDEPVIIDGKAITAGMRVGIAMCPDHASDAETLVAFAESALLAARDADTTYHVYAPNQTNRIAALWGMEQELDAALTRGELELYYQPKIRVRDRKPCGAEALMRWTSPTRGFVSPDVFIPVADATGRIEPLTRFALNTALRQATEWPTSWGPLSIAVNVTPNVIENTELIELVKDALAIWNIPASHLIVEVTEGALINNVERSFQILQGLRAEGVQISIDDFGTGYSSLAYFKNIPANELKIDRSFVMNMFEDEADERIVRAVVNLAHGFGLDVTAEGVENEATVEVLSDIECDYIQGYFFSRPLPQDDFIRWLTDYVPG